MFDESAAEVRRFCPRRVADLIDSREPQLLAGIVTELRVVNGQRGRVGIFKLDDCSEPIEAVVNEDQLDAHRELLREDELIVVQGKVQPDRFSGGFRLNINQVWDLAGARARFGRYLAVEVNGGTPPVAELVRSFPARVEQADDEAGGGELVQGLGVRLLLKRPGASAELDLGAAGRIWPSDQALAKWRQLAHEGRASVVYA